MNFNFSFLLAVAWLSFKEGNHRPRRLLRLLFIACLGVVSFAGLSQAQPPSPKLNQPGIEEVDRPQWKFFRYREDWSVLKDVPEPQRADPWDQIKYLPLDEQGAVWASFGGHMRLRFEDWTDFSFGAPATSDDAFLLWRLLLHSDLHLGKNLRVFVEGKSALSEGRDLPDGRRTLDFDTIALQQAFIDLRIHLPRQATLVLRPGRQSMGFGKQRLVSTLPWGNTLRAWDGITGILQAGEWKTHGFWSRFAPVQKYEFNDSDEGSEFFGVYGMGKIARTGLDLYWLGIDREGQSFNGTAGTESRHTLGARIWGGFPNTSFDYDLEGAHQFGSLGSGGINAYMVATQVGYRFADGWGRPRVFLGFDYASGDDSSGSDVETFNQLFPLGHAHLGFMDIIGRQNIIDFNQGVALHPARKLTVNANGHLFWRASDADALYNAGGGVVRKGNAATARNVGSEVDFTAKFKFDRHLLGLFGYSHFFAGDFIQDSGADNDVDFIYLQFQYTF